MAHAKAYEGIRDEHANLHAHHAALSEVHEKAGQKDLAHLHHRMAGHHLKLAEHHAVLADAIATPGAEATERSEATSATKATPAAASAPAGKSRAVGDTLAMGAATQLHRKGHIDAKTHARIHREARRRPFGSLGGGAGHYMGDEPAENSGGTNSVP